MSRYNYDRLTALDNSFLLLERPNAFMHVASVAIHEAAPLRRADGALDLDLLRRGISGLLHRIPRYRQKLAWVPIERSPVWIDDPNFSLDYHLRHTSLPRPGNEAQLKALAARVMAQRLDRTRPMWELWVVEGLEGDRLAIINKTHHCMIDGVSGVDLLNVMMSPTPEFEIVEAPPFMPRPAPGGSQLLRDEVLRRIMLPLSALRGMGWKLIGEAQNQRRELLSRLRAASEMIGMTLRSASPTPFNQPIGPHRRFDWIVHELDQLKAIRKSLGGSLNDLVLAIVAGAVRRFLEYRRVELSGLDFTVMAPVSVRREDERGNLGNRVSAWFVNLPVAEADPQERLRLISERTLELKQSKSAVGAELLTQVAEWTPATLLSLGARNATRLQPFNLVVTNVPGPQVPIHLFGSRMERSFPLVPLTENLGLGIALFSYDGQLCWGFNADYELLPDLDRFVKFIGDAYQELRVLAEPAPVPSASAPPPPPPQEHTPVESAPAPGSDTAPPVEPPLQPPPTAGESGNE